MGLTERENGLLQGLWGVIKAGAASSTPVVGAAIATVISESIIYL